MRIEGKTTGKDIKKAVTFGSNCFIISGATRNRTGDTRIFSPLPDPYVPNVVRYQLRYIPIIYWEKVVSPGIEPGTQGFSVLCSTN